MWGEAICISLAILGAGFLIASHLSDLDETLKRILKRYAALENLGLFPPDPDDDPDFYSPCAICKKSNAQGHAEGCPNTSAGIIRRHKR